VDRQIVVTVRNGSSRVAQDIGSSGKAYGALGRYQVSPAALRDVGAIAGRHGLRQVAAWPIEVLGVHCVVFAIDDDRPLETVLAAVAADRSVESAQPMGVFRTQGSAARYDDPYLRLQESIATMQVEEAHRWSRGGGVRIAIIDSAIDAGHPDLARRVVVARDLTLSADRRQRTEDHGTAIAGIIAAGAGNGLGIIGVAPDARILALRACWQEGPSSSAVCDTLSLAQALAVALTERADIINLSLTGPRDALLERLVRRALAMGKVVVAAVPEQGIAGFPAEVSGVLAVASAEATHSSATVPGTLYAPGRQVLTLRPGARYDYENGSSMAAANVSGVAALLLAREPRMGVAQLRRLLSEASQPTLAAGLQAPRMINACRALAALAPQAGRDGCGPLRRMHAARR
jgi:subtilisin family serine protease